MSGQPVDEAGDVATVRRTVWFQQRTGTDHHNRMGLTGFRQRGKRDSMEEGPPSPQTRLERSGSPAQKGLPRKRNTESTRSAIQNYKNFKKKKKKNRRKCLATRPWPRALNSTLKTPST